MRGGRSEWPVLRRLPWSVCCGVVCSEYCAGTEVQSTVVSVPPTFDASELCETSSPSHAASTEYMNKIRKRLNEDASARVEREKRRRKVLVQQLTAHQAIEVRHPPVCRRVSGSIKAVHSRRALSMRSIRPSVPCL